MSTGVADGDGADNLAVVQHAQLPGVARDAGPDQSIGRERHWLHLSVGTHMERVRTGTNTRPKHDKNNATNVAKVVNNITQTWKFTCKMVLSATTISVLSSKHSSYIFANFGAK